MKRLTHNLEVNYPCSPVCPLFGDCVVAFRNEQKKRVRTNADRIRAMSDEQMATDLLRMFEELCEDGIPSPECMRFWLQQPVEEGD